MSRKTGSTYRPGGVAPGRHCFRRAHLLTAQGPPADQRAEIKRNTLVNYLFLGAVEKSPLVCRTVRCELGFGNVPHL
jgi:hypothetical protein